MIMKMIMNNENGENNNEMIIINIENDNER